MSNTKSGVQSNKNNKKLTISRYAIGFLLPLILVLGFIYPLVGYFMFVCMFAAIAISFFNGRYWCYWACPRGIFFDEYLNKISLKKKIPALFKHTAFRLLWIAILMSMLTFRFIQSNGNIYVLGKALVLLLTITTAVGVVLGLVYNSRI